MKKMLGEERRLQLLELLKKSNTPITGTDFAKFANVSRQVIVNDMTLLKARNEPIIATSQGYIYMHQAATLIKLLNARSLVFTHLKTPKTNC
ncbi:hypothetical protein LSPH24S_01338 [Lysinibacillus sphaericus]